MQSLAWLAKKLLLPVLGLAIAGTCTAQLVAWSYQKLERMIPMRDGIELYTAIYIPRDSSKAWPILMERTPYGCKPYGERLYPPALSHNELLLDDNYIFVFQDVRGRFMSQGKFTEVTPFIAQKTSPKLVDESSDAFDTIDWLVKNIPGNNGKVGMYGVSYPAFYAVAALVNVHPALAAISPQAPVIDEFEGDDVYHRGAFYLLDNANFLNGFGSLHHNPTGYYPQVNPALNNDDAYQFYLKLGPIKNVNRYFFKNRSEIWNQYLQHDTKDSYWRQRNIRPFLYEVKPAVLTVGGWFDPEDLYGTLKSYEAIEKQNPQNNSFLLIGPWTHGAWRRSNFNSYATYDFNGQPNDYFKVKEAAFFRYYLKGRGNLQMPEATVFFTGSNQWKSFSQWPPAETRPFDLYLTAGRKLSTLPEPSRLGFEQYDSDPSTPVPYSPLKMGTRDNSFMGADQRFSATRPDVLVFISDTLKYDWDMAGPVVARLFVSTTGTDADFVVKLIDVLPDGTQRLVRAEVMRGKFRSSLSSPIPFVPERITPVTVTLNDIAHRFMKGHKMMVHIQSSWFPLVDRNPQQFMRIPDAGEGDFIKSTIKIERNARYQSVIQCRVLR